MAELPGPQALSQWMAVDPSERSARAVADALGVSEVTVRNWAGGATVPAPRGRALLACLLASPLLSDVEAWMVVVDSDRRVGVVHPDVMDRVLAARVRWERIAEAKAPAAQDGAP